MSKHGTCKLCGSYSKLIKQSHIIPNFMYKSLLDEGNKFFFLSLKNNIHKPQVFQTGVFDKYILCRTCENELLSKLEKYSSYVLYGGRSKEDILVTNKKSLDGIRTIHVQNIDYRKFKLFVLSVIWRAHISSHVFFKNVDIGSHDKIIKGMLLSGNAGLESEYRISIFAFKDSSDNLMRFFLNPEVKKDDENHFITFFINGFLYFISLQTDSSFSFLTTLFLKESGEIEIPILSGELANNMLNALGLSKEFSSFFTELK